MSMTQVAYLIAKGERSNNQFTPAVTEGQALLRNGVGRCRRICVRTRIRAYICTHEQCDTKLNCIVMKVLHKQTALMCETLRNRTALSCGSVMCHVEVSWVMWKCHASCGSFHANELKCHVSLE